MIFKLTYQGQTHLYNKTACLKSLEEFCFKAFRDLPSEFSLIYQSENGEMTYIESDEDLIGLKYCCSLKNDFIVKLVVMRSTSVQEEQMQSVVKDIVSQNMAKLNQKVIDTLEDEVVSHEIENYLSSTYERISDDLATAEQRMIQDEVASYLDTLYEVTSSKLAQTQDLHKAHLDTQSRKRVVRFSPQKPKILKDLAAEKTVEEIVDAKILKLIPTLVDKIYSKIESRMEKQCRECIKRELAIERAIEKELALKMDSSFTLLEEEENPEF